MAGKGKKKTAAHGLGICENRRAKHRYALSDNLEAGLVLTGTEVKACRARAAHLNEAYVHFRGGEAFLVGAHIAEYTQGNRFNHPPDRARKLLLQRRQLDVLAGQVAKAGMTVVPLRLYFSPQGHIKLEVALGQGKRDVDKRQDIKERDSQRELERALRQRQK